MYFQDFEDYLESLAASHVDMLHGTDGRCSFARLLSDDEINTIMSNPGPYVLILDNLTGRSVGEIDENKFQQTWVLTFLGYHSPGTANPTANRDAVIQKAWDIMMDFRAKMLHDWYTDQCGALRGISFNMNWKVINDMQLDQHYGWELTIQQTVVAPDYNAAKWV